MMAKGDQYRAPWAPGHVAGRQHRDTEVPPWPLPAVPWGLSWAYWEMELNEELKAARRDLRRARRERRTAMHSQDSDKVKDHSRRSLREASSRVELLTADLEWCRRGLACVAVED